MAGPPSVDRNMVVYGHGEWARHTHPWRHGHHLTTMVRQGLPTLPAILVPVSMCTAVAVAVTVLNELVLDRGAFRLRAGHLPFQLTCPVLLLLLGFRINSSYQRYEEARRAWGSMVNRARDFATQALTWGCGEGDGAKLERLLRHLKALPYCVKDLLTIQESLREEVRGVLEPCELERVMGSRHRPNTVLLAMAAVVAELPLGEVRASDMGHNLTQFHDNVGACERIFKTPIPVRYTSLISRLLTLWHCLLPLGLWESCGWGTIPATLISTVALFYVEEVGVVLEEPMSVLPLLSICDGISSSIEGLCADHAEERRPYAGDYDANVSTSKPGSARSEGFSSREGEIAEVVFGRANSVR